jgi:hypothetical protein
MITGACPCKPECAIEITGAYSNEVAYSVALPIMIPAINPVTTHPKILVATICDQYPRSERM